MGRSVRAGPLADNLWQCMQYNCSVSCPIYLLASTLGVPLVIGSATSRLDLAGFVLVPPAGPAALDCCMVVGVLG